LGQKTTRQVVEGKLLKLKALILIVFIFAVKPGQAKPAEEYKQEIKRAENLLLQKERPRAIKALTVLLENDKLGKNGSAEIKKILKEISSLFLHEKAQQNFELALNLKKTDPAQSMQKLLEAQATEPDNFKIIAEISKQKIAKKECKNIIPTLESSMAINPWDEGINLALAQAYFCEGEAEKASLLIGKNIETKRKNTKKEWLQIDFLNRLKNKDSVKNKELLKELKERDPSNPQLEVYDVLLQVLESPNNENLNKSSLACKSTNASLLRQYQQDPFFCELDLLISLINKSR
jgi:thioredoxin-like negative regulator of GroEL